ncbi:MAG TPA: hypothetical protein VI583_11460 [Cyclobacteriaceae bacterium]|nr:hypothetical protein [Cyclobacteriaceae bacterium]
MKSCEVELSLVVHFTTMKRLAFSHDCFIVHPGGVNKSSFQTWKGYFGEKCIEIVTRN